jgi:hypothetical protein
MRVRWWISRIAWCAAAVAMLGGDALAQRPGGRIPAEKDGYLLVEAEAFERQEKDSVRRWYVQRKNAEQRGLEDWDGIHAETASGGAYLEVLPDTRRTHGDKLTAGVNFSNKGGEMAVLRYRVRIQNPGRYYVWVRAFSTGSEDNGIHVGLNGQWPESGQRMQWCDGKRRWRWESKQRTNENHCGEEGKIWLDIETAGEHTIQFSMREDGFEFDQWLLTKDRNFVRPPDGPVSR